MTLLFRTSLAFVLTLFFAGAAWPTGLEEDPSDQSVRAVGESDLTEFVWKKRPILVFADSEADPAFITQMSLINERLPELLARDVVILTDTAPEDLSPARKRLRPRGFMLVILSKEGKVQLRKPFPWDVREISRTIDKLPIRQREIRESKSRPSN